VYYFTSLVDKTCIEFSPKCNFFDYLLYSFFFLFGLSPLGVLILSIPGFLFFFQKLYLRWYFFAKTQFQRELVIIRKCESRLMYFFLVLLILKDLRLYFRRQYKAKYINFSSLMVVADWGIAVIIETLLLQTPYNFTQIDLLFCILLNINFDCDGPILISLFLKNYVQFNLVALPLWSATWHLFPLHLIIYNWMKDHKLQKLSIIANKSFIFEWKSNDQ
jgi:hypothetical protein